MFHVRDVMLLETNEHLVAVVRRHASTVLPGLVFAGVLIALPFFFLFPLIKLGFFGAVVISVFLALGFYFALKTVFAWDANALVITDKRVVSVRQRGPWDRRVTELPLAGISVTAERRGFLDRLRGTGVLGCMGAGSSTLVMADIGRPERLAQLINKLRDARNGGFTMKEVS